jgi:hypothetical protein
MKTLQFSHEITTLYHIIVLTAAEYSCPRVCILDFRLHLHRGFLHAVNISNKIVIENEFSRVTIVFVFELRHDAGFLVDSYTVAVDIESGEATLVAFLLFSIVSRPNYLL